MGDQNESYFGEELFNLFAYFLNSPSNRKFLDSIRGEYGVLWYLMKVEEPVVVGVLSEQLHVVPGRMTDILKSLEKKGYIERSRDPEDRRVVRVTLLEAGYEEAKIRRTQIKQKYAGLSGIFSQEEEKELLRLLKLLLTFTE